MLRFLHKILPCQNLILFQTNSCLIDEINLIVYQNEKQKKKNTNKIQEFLHKLLIAVKTIFEIIIVLKAIIEIIFD